MFVHGLYVSFTLASWFHIYLLNPNLSLRYAQSSTLSKAIIILLIKHKLLFQVAILNQG